MRLIDADVFDAIINDDGTIDVYATETARNAMLIMPTVDAVPVVRCRECIRWRHSKTNTAAKVCDWDRYEKTENDFCSWAKRKDDD